MRRRWFAKTLALFVIAAAALALGFYLHFRLTPAFVDFLRTHPVDQARFDALQPSGELLADGDRWVTGDDPFEIESGDTQPRQTTVFELDILRGPEVLLHLVQEFSIVMREADGERTGAGVRTLAISTGDDVRAEVRVYVHDLDKLLAIGGGAITFDVVLGAGEGRDRVAVAAIPHSELGAEPQHSDPSLPGFLRYLWPLVDLPAEGLLHRTRARVFQSFMRVPGGTQSAAMGEIVHDVNTTEYSYEMKSTVKLVGDGGTSSSRSITRRQSFTWNEKIW